MALLHFNDFDSPLGEYTENDWGPPANVAYSEAGSPSKGIRVGDNSATTYQATFPLNTGTIIFGGRTQILDASPDDFYLYCTNERSERAWELRPTTAGAFLVLDGNGTIVATTAVGFTLTQWFTLEVKCTYGNSSTFEVRADGVEIYASSTFDSQGANGTGFSYLRTGGSGSSDIDNAWWDRLWWMDGTGTEMNDFTGLLTCEHLMPDANGNLSGWTGSDGNSTDNYLLVNDDPINTAEWVEAGTQGDTDLYSHDTATGGEGIVAVGLFYKTALPGGGQRYLRPSMRVNATNYTPETSKTVNNENFLQFFTELNPDDSAAWEQADVNAAEFGMEVRDT